MRARCRKKGISTTELLVRCLLCGEGLRYQRDDTWILIVHLRDKHPNATLSQLPCQTVPKSAVRARIESRPNINEVEEERMKRRLFKTTVETWRPGPSKITCPSCGKTASPVVRKQKSRVSRSQLAAMCLVGCWPLCFLPCMLSRNSTMDLHCCFCGYYLGTYNATKMTITPNSQACISQKFDHVNSNPLKSDKTLGSHIDCAMECRPVLVETTISNDLIEPPLPNNLAEPPILDNLVEPPIP